MISRLNNELFHGLLAKAAESSRKRSHYNFHENEEDAVQRLCIALKQGTYVRPHQHTRKNKWELLLILSGAVNFVVFDNKGEIIEKLDLSLEGSQRGIEIKPNTWHTVYPTSDEAIILEVKEGPFTPTKESEFASWAPLEGQSGVDEFLRWLVSASVGEKYEKPNNT